jgi:hypothetical protein
MNIAINSQSSEMKQYLHPLSKKRIYAWSIEEEGETMSRNMNNFTPLPGLWRTTGSRAYGDASHNSNNSHEFNEVPVFYRSHHSTRANVSIS